MIPIDRRAFLAQIAATPVLYGLCSEQAKDGEDPAWLAQALARMKETGRWGVLLVLPASAEARQALSFTLWAITAFDNEDLDAHRLFCEAIFIVATPELAARRFPRQEAAGRVLLSFEGQPLASDTTDLALVGQPGEFAKSFGRFIHGEHNRRLLERARTMEQEFPPELKDALSKLGSDSDEARLQAATAVIRKIEGLTPYLMYLAETAEAPRQRLHAQNLLTSYFGSLRPDASGAKVPYGCSGPHHYDPCASCGMGRIPERSRMFLKFLVPGAPRSPKDR